MDTKDVLYNLRAKKGLSQDELAEKIFVTRQAVSRWETGETTPNVETLKLLSKFYDVSINTLLGSPRRLICQCCGMPLEDSLLSRETDGSFNEEYCKWCYADGKFTYSSKEQLIDFCAKHMASESWPEQQVRAHMEALVPTLNHWRNNRKNLCLTLPGRGFRMLFQLRVMGVSGALRLAQIAISVRMTIPAAYG